MDGFGKGHDRSFPLTSDSGGYGLQPDLCWVESGQKERNGRVLAPNEIYRALMPELFY